MNNYFPPVYYAPDILFSHPLNLSPAQFLEFSKIVSDGFKKIPSKEDIEKYFLIINKISDNFILKETIYDEALRIRVISEILNQKNNITEKDINDIAVQYIDILKSENPNVDSSVLIDYAATLASIIGVNYCIKTKSYNLFVSALSRIKELE